MVHNLTYSTNILDTFGVLSSFNFAEKIWNRYEKYAIPKLEEATLKIRGSLFYIKDLTPIQAEKELRSLEQLTAILSNFRDTPDLIDEQKYKHFKKAVTQFFDSIDLLHDNLKDIAQIHSSYEMAMPVLAEDWDSDEDSHWDKY